MTRILLRYSVARGESAVERRSPEERNPLISQGVSESGRPGSNRRPYAWQAYALAN